MLMPDSYDMSYYASMSNNGLTEVANIILEEAFKMATYNP